LNTVIAKFGCAVLAALLFGSGASALAASLLVNGSFETPTVPAGGYTTFAVGSSAITGWTVVGPAGANVAPVSTTFTQNGVAFVAQDGNQWLDLTGLDSNNAEGVSQSVATTIGNAYQLTYFVGNTTGGNIFGTSSTVNVFVNGVHSFIDSNFTPSPTMQNWQAFQHTFVAGSASTVLSFINGDPGGDNTNGLDNIVLVDLGPTVGAVPEPETYATMLAGLALMAFVGARRTRSKR